ncbi:MAG: hypothetical protein R3C49_20715 [Planctomycetaceae bacterium]
MALGIFGADVDDDGIIIGPPLHGESWSDDRITFSLITLAADLGLEFAAGAKLRATNYGFLTVEGELKDKFNCNVTGECTVARSKKGELEPDQPERREDRKFSIAGAIDAGCDGGLTLAAKVNPLGLEYDLSIPLISGVPPSLTKKDGGDRLSQRLAKFSFADRSLSLDWRLDELPGIDPKQLKEALQRAQTSNEKIEFVDLRDLVEWLRKHSVNLEVKTSTIALAEGSKSPDGNGILLTH